MSIPPLFLNDRPLPIGRLVGRGGEGVVHALRDHPDHAVKTYLRPDARHAAKIMAMVAAQLASRCPDVAFPLGIARDEHGTVAGFTMRLIADAQPVHELMTTGSRRELFPHADWRFLVRAAINIARVVAGLHAVGAVVGGINSSGFLVSPRATATLIDADSLQVAQYRCRVGMPEYTPPELQGQRLDGIERTPAHDAFGLAVLLFQVIALGRHPFAGVKANRPLSIDESIRQHRFAFSLVRKVGLTPPPASLLLSDLPVGVRLLFERAFAGRPELRPSALEWVDELSRLEARLSSCPENETHVVATHAAPCPWCRIERQLGRAVFAPRAFPPAFKATEPVAALEQEVTAAITFARHHASENIEPGWARPVSRPSCRARKLRPNLNASRSIWPPSSVVLSMTEPFEERHAAADLKMRQALDMWRTTIGVWSAARSSARLQEDLNRLKRLTSRTETLVGQEIERMLRQTVAHDLVTRRIEPRSVAGLGKALVGMLAQHGVGTAADITRGSLERIAGLGEARVTALLLWRDGIAAASERRIDWQAFVHTARADARKCVAAEMAALAEALRHGCHDVMCEAVKVRDAATLIDTQLDVALRELDEATADLNHLGIRSRSRHQPQATSKHPTGGKAAAVKPGKACPLCAAPMVKRWRATGPQRRIHYLGCSRYPSCSGTRPLR